MPWNKAAQEPTRERRHGTQRPLDGIVVDFHAPITACELKTHFLVRTCVDRLAGDGQHTITAEMEEVRVKRLHHVEAVDSRANQLGRRLSYATGVFMFCLR